MYSVIHLCWWSTSSSKFLLSLLLPPMLPQPLLQFPPLLYMQAFCWECWNGPMPFRAILAEEDWHTWRANPLILFSPRKPLALAFFRSCCRNAFKPVVQRRATIIHLLPLPDNVFLGNMFSTSSEICSGPTLPLGNLEQLSQVSDGRHTDNDSKGLFIYSYSIDSLQVRDACGTSCLMCQCLGTTTLIFWGGVPFTALLQAAECLGLTLEIVYHLYPQHQRICVRV